MKIDEPTHILQSSDPYQQDIRSETSPELMAIHATLPFIKEISSSRAQMYGSHIGQHLGVRGATVRRIQSGCEKELAKYNFAIRMPCNANILKIIQKYPKTYDKDSIKENPLTIVVYENLDEHEIGCLELVRYHCIHQYYGFRYQYKAIDNMIYPGAYVSAGTVIANSPQVTSTGYHMYGLESKVAMMSTHLNIEDGVVIGRSYAKRLTTKGFGTISVSCGKNYYPINLKGYGTIENPKAFPDIGDRIRPDGLLCVFRKYDDLLAPVDLSPRNMQIPDYAFDKPYFAEPGAKVIDVIVHQGLKTKTQIPTGMSAQFEKYMGRTNAFYDDLLREERALRKSRNGVLKLSPQFHRLLVEANAMRGDDPKNRSLLTFNRNPLDEWRVTIVYEYDMVPDIGSKITDCFGGKGVICDIWEDERMPLDKWGVRCEVMFDDSSTIKRMNDGRLYEQAINCAGEYVKRVMTVKLGSKTPAEIDYAFADLEVFYRLVSPPHWYHVAKLGIPNTHASKLEHMEKCIEDEIHLFCPTDNPVVYVDVINQIDKMYPDLIGPVSYIGNSGVRVTTISDVMIGSMYLMLLEKTGNTWAGVSSARLQHFGIPAKLTQKDKNTTPARPNPVRILGETEVRLFATTAGSDITSDLLDQTNNPVVHREILNTILHAEQPSNIEKVIDREEFPMGNGRMLLYMNHTLECAGMRFVRRKETS